MKFIEKETFFLKCSHIPSGTAQQRKIAVVRGRVMTYPSDSYIEAKKVYTLLLNKHKPKTPITGAVFLSVSYRYETPKKKQQFTFKTTRPDGDNLLKVFKDCMTQLKFFNDDSQVCIEEVSRIWVPKGEGGILVTIGEIESEVY